MNIGIVTTWFERGAAYVSRQYLEALRSDSNNSVYIYARGGESYARNQSEWDRDFVTWGKVNKKYYCGATGIEKRDFIDWLKNRQIDVVLFNEQNWWIPVIWCKELGIKVGTYVDYYTEETVPFFAIYDYILCNTKRHYRLFKDLPQSFYIPWGTDINLFSNNIEESCEQSQITFFHSAGMNPIRKGTDTVIAAFLSLPAFYKDKAKLLIHTQVALDNYVARYDQSILLSSNIEVRTETVAAPGLYHLGDIYVYPSILDGLGLTVAEALSCGLPCIVPDNAPMNEFIQNGINGRIAEVEYLYARSDGYFWPQCKVSVKSIQEQMIYYLNNIDRIKEFKKEARIYAEQNLNWKDRYMQVCEILKNATIAPYKEDLVDQILCFEHRKTGKFNVLPYAFYYWKKLKG